MLSRPFENMTRGDGFAIAVSPKVFLHRSTCLAATFLTLLPGVHPLRAQDAPAAPRITFRKIMKGSSPEYMSVSIDANGKGTYEGRKLDDPPAPRPLQLSAATTAQVFSLAESLHNFRSLDLDTHHKVANMGMKTLIYESGKQTNQVQYNYTENNVARQLTEIFEKISNVEEYIGQLEYSMKYDHLNLPQILRQIQDDLADHSLVEAELLRPTLEKIANNSKFLHLARARAQEIMQAIQENQ